MALTLIQAQQRYIDRVNNIEIHPSYVRRVAKAAWSQLYKWAEKHGYDPKVVCQDAKDMATLENSHIAIDWD